MSKLFDRKKIIKICLCVTILWLSGQTVVKPLFGTESTELPESESFAFVHVNVIPMDKERVLLDQTVIVQNGRINKIGPASSTNIPTGATMKDTTGKYLIPSLSDMHVHMLGESWNIMFPPEAQFSADELDFSKLLFLYVANGVATIQVMSALPEHIPLRDQISRGEILGPRLILARMIDGPGQAWPPPLSTWVETADQARQAVLDAKEAGYDKMKVYSFLNQESYDSIMATAKEVGMPVEGHIPMVLSVEYILEAGQNLIAHSEEVMKHTKGNYDQENINYYAEIIAESDIWITPTLIMKKNLLAILDGYDKELTRPEVRYLHPMALGVWSFLTTNIYLKMPPEHRDALKKGFDLFEKPFTKALHDKGARLLAGTDALVPTTIPGFSLHRELKELVDVGLTPYEALRTSTTYPFEFLGEPDEAGTIEVGKRANLVLLEANPLEEITNTSKIAGVMIGGRWISKFEIQIRLEELPVFYESIKK
ncbi:MAG: amidohydrolase family protein [Spirochaetota bacterium]|nr:MAG: amidohydrolase family protein [Spirochaetota bacterium]